ncbi:MAG: hypothetical protein HYZ14_18830 [Bacteroidetes bacterium]|nr:hypothetical protein [Bacteroidota bacterium]
MKNFAVVALLSCSFGCANHTPENASLQSENNTGKLSPETEITSLNAADVTSYENTPESIAMYFYASRIRKDTDWEKVCVAEPERRPKFQNGLEKYATWNFEKYRFVRKEEFRPDAWWVTIYMAINVDGHTSDGEDEVTVEKINGTFLITEVPT